MYKKAVSFIQDWRDDRLSKRIVKKLYSIPKEEWLRIGWQFNRWQFPMEFYKFMPKRWVEKGQWDKGMAQRIVAPICIVVSREFGLKERLRYHNVIRGNMQEDEFEYWFDINYRINDSSERYTKKQQYYDRYVKIKTLRWWENEVFEKIASVIKFEEE